MYVYPFCFDGSACSAGDPGLILWSGQSGEGNGNQFQYFCLENCMERGAWQASLWGYKESDRTEGLTQNHLLLLVVVQSLSHV